jgi:VanZ family protein
MFSVDDSYRLRRRAAGALWILALCATLFAALRPFCTPKNEVFWAQDRDALAFGRAGTVLSSEEFDFAADKESSCSIEIWFEPALVWGRGTILSFYKSSTSKPLSVQQDYTSLIIQLGVPSYDNAGKPPQLEIADVFRRRQIFLTITSNGRDAAVYVDGRLVSKRDGFGLTARSLFGRLIIATSAMRANNWSGSVRGLAVYNRMLKGSEVAEHYKDWMQSRRPRATKGDSPVALYMFREREGTVINDMGTSGIGLYIPVKFVVIKHLFLEAPWNEVYSDRYYLENCLLNVAGFVPFGFFGAAYVASFRCVRRPALVAIVIGGCISLLIEIGQAYLPTRFSGVTDIITNTVGTAAGTGLYRSGVLSVKRILAKVSLA